MHRYARSGTLLHRAALLSQLWTLCAIFHWSIVTQGLDNRFGYHLASDIVYQQPKISSYRINYPSRHTAFIPPARIAHNGISLPFSRTFRHPGTDHGIPTYRMVSNGNLDHGSPMALGLFGNLFGWFSNKFSAKWYVPPMPIGLRASDVLKAHGPLQTEEETQKFFETIGAHRNASLVEINKAYEKALDTLPEDVHVPLRAAFNEFLRKDFVKTFEHMESYMDRGPQAWEEYWDPKKDVYGNPVKKEFESPEEEEKVMMSRLPPQLNATKFRDYWRRKHSKFSTLLKTVDMPSRVRLTSNFTGRLKKCSSTMLPICLLGLFPQFASLSIALQGLMASGIIFKGDRKVLLEREKEIDEYVSVPTPKASSASSKTLLTSMVLCIHGALGMGMCKLLGQYTSILEYLTPQILKTACINLQFFIAALFYDTSDLTPHGHAEREQKRLDRISDTLEYIEK